MSKLEPTQIWKSEKAKEYFMKLFSKAEKTTVDWEKFRKFDKKGIFENIPNNKLSMKFRTLHLKQNGLCWYCGKEKGKESNGLCLDCNELVKDTQKQYIDRLKEEKENVK